MRHKEDNETLFKGQLECQRCSYTREGYQCKHNTCKYLPMCWQHAAITYGVKVAPSTIAGAGNGLFALRDFKAGEWIAPLLGEIITAAEGDRRYGEATAPYVVTHSGLATENKLGTDKARRERSRGSRAWARWLLVEGSGCAEGQRLAQQGRGERGNPT